MQVASTLLGIYMSPRAEQAPDDVILSFFRNNACPKYLCPCMYATASEEGLLCCGDGLIGLHNWPSQHHVAHFGSSGFLRLHDKQSC